MPCKTKASPEEMLDNPLMAYSNRKRSCGKMIAHFVTALFLITSISIRIS